MIWENNQSLFSLLVVNFIYAHYTYISFYKVEHALLTMTVIAGNNQVVMMAGDRLTKTLVNEEVAKVSWQRRPLIKMTRMYDKQTGRQRKSGGSSDICRNPADFLL